MTLQLQSAFGLIALPAIAWLLSERRHELRAAPMLKLLLAGIVLQFLIAGLLLNVPMLRAAFNYPAALVEALQTATRAGVQLVFGHLAGAPPPYDVKFPANSFVLALDALPLVLVMSVLSKLLYHWGVLQLVVSGFAALLQRTLGIGGAVGTSAAANVFMGNVEAPLLVRPYIATMSRADLFATMTVGMAGVAGTVLGIYVILLKAQLPDAAGHLIVASVISVPAALVISALMVPQEAHERMTPERVAVTETTTRSFMDAVTQGTREGIDLLVAITAMLIVAVALVTLVNMMLAAATAPFGTVLTLEGIVGVLFTPLAFVIGIPWGEAAKAGELIGVKTIFNEFLAYLKLAAVSDGELSARSRLLMAYALCGFANFGSLGIMIGGLVAMAPSRRADILDLAPRTIVAGTLATLMTAAVIGVLTPP